MPLANDVPREGDRQAILVLGMHRSGTSSLSGLLSHLGADPAKTLIRGDNWNERGYWESDRFGRFHDRILSSAGSVWNDWRRLNPAWTGSQDEQRFLTEFAGLIEEEFGQSRLFVVKDPRMCRIAPFWIRGLTAIGITPKFVIPLRNPLEVALSLERRDGIPITEGLLLWLRHCLDAEYATRSHSRSFIQYDDLLRDWRSNIAKVATGLDINFPTLSSGASNAVDGFLSLELRHHIVSAGDLDAHEEVFDWTRRAYGHLKALIDGNDAEAMHELDDVRQAFDQACTLFDGVIQFQKDKTAALTHEIAELKATLSTSAEQRDELAAKIDHLDKSLATSLQKRRASLISLAKQVDKNRSMSNELVAMEKRVQIAITGEMERRTSTEVELSERDCRISDLSNRLAERTADYHRIYHVLLNARAKPFKTLRRFAKWRLSAALLALEPALPKRLASRVRRRMHKSSPVPVEDFIVVEVPTTMKSKWSRQQRRKYKASRFVLQFRHFLPTRLIHRTERRMEKNAPPPPGDFIPARSESHTHLIRATSTAVLNPGHTPAHIPAGSYVPLDTSGRMIDTAIRAIAFYLPQFHPIPENDDWWGKGFTEWTNVSKATPQFVGHYQPRLPGELGFYDLRLVEVQKRQIELAKQYGLHGFCFHYYWFTGGRRLLEHPLNQYLAHKELDFPFCICWANENWTRRWDGSEHEILMEQRYAPEDDLEIIKDMEPLLRDPRYIKVDGRPIIIVYRVTLLPDAKRTANTWRNYCREAGLGNPLLIAAQSFGIGDPRPYGFDAAVEFPPHGVGLREVGNLDLYNPHHSGKVYDYRHLAETAKKFEWPDYQLFKGIIPSWDNEARRPGRGHVYFGSTPDIYRDWLSHLCNKTNDRYASPDEKLVFINAWNEWGEGAYLEPDRGYGYAYLAATRDALESVKPSDTTTTEKPLILVSHDALPYGAQFLALNIARVLSTDMRRSVKIILFGDGPLKSEFEKYGVTYDLSGATEPDVVSLVQRLRSEGCQAAICNTTVAGHIVPQLKASGIKVLSLIHELPGVIDEYNLQNAARAISQHADHVVFPAEIVASDFDRIAPIDLAKRLIEPQGLYKKNRLRTHGDIARAKLTLRQRFNLNPETLIVLAVGHVSDRKGTDLFVQAALHVLQEREEVFFLWAGPNEVELTDKLRSQIGAAGYARHFAFSGIEQDTDTLYAGADIYTLTSREDPFPSVVMEAMDAGLPVVAFAAAVGNLNMIANVGGAVVPAFDIKAYADALLAFLANSTTRNAAGTAGRAMIEKEFSFHRYVKTLLSHCTAAPARVSVVVPNFNYAHLLDERISTIAHQNFPIHELIFLDDASSDKSLEVARRKLAMFPATSRIIANEKNSGSVFRQWLRGVEAATGDYVWIAEADDLSEHTFLAEAIRAFSNPDVVMSYCQSKQIDGDGRILAENYLDYVSEISSTRWRSAYIAGGRDEISSALAVKNTIPNVSAVVFRREALLEVLRAHCEEITSYRVAGDWLVYGLLLKKGRLAYSPKALNLHRRHESGVTMGLNLARHLAEIMSVQARLRALYPELNRHTDAANAYARKIQRQFNLEGDLDDYRALVAAE